MLAEFVEKLVGLGRKSASVQIVEVPGDPRKVLVAHNGEFKDRDVPCPLLDARVESFADFVAFVNDRALCSAPIVYFDKGGFVAVRNEQDRREFLRLSFAWSRRWLALVRVADGVKFTPKDAIRFLRFELGGIAAEPVVAALRKVDFKRAEGAVSSVKRGQEAFGRQVEMSVQQADDVPAQFRVQVAPVTNDGLADRSVEVEVFVEIDVEAQAIEFRLVSDALVLAEETFLRGVGGELRKSLGSTPVFRGGCVTRVADSASKGTGVSGK